MENYFDGVENTQDYLEGEKTEALMSLSRLPNQAELPTHLRMVYGHVEWRNLVYKLDDDIISVISKNKDSICVGKDVLTRIKKGDHVVIVDNYDMAPVTFKEMITDSVCFELYDLDEAIDRAAHFYVDDVLESVFSFPLFTPYFLMAFRLALMDGEMEDYERFGKERLEEVWRKTYSTVLYFASKELKQRALDMGKSSYSLVFDLTDYMIEDYEEKLNHGE